MSKGRKKYDASRAQAIKWTADKYEVSEQYVRNIDNNPNMDYGRCNEIRKAFRAKYAELQQVLS